MPRPLSPEQLRHRVDPAQFPFETTADLEPERRPLGQERALRALDFGIEVDSEGYNIFVLGASGAGKRTTVLSVLEEAARRRPVPDDWVYLFNFDDEERPLAVPLPPGTGEALRQDMEALVRSLLTEIPKAFSGDGYEKEKAAAVKEAQEEKARAFRELEGIANTHGFLVQRSAEGLALIYTHEGSPVSQEDFEKLPEEEQEKVREARELLQAKLRDTIEAVREVDRKVKEALKTLERRVALAAVGHEIESLAEKYRSHPAVVDYLKAVEKDVVENLDEFRSAASETPALPFPFRPPTPEQRTRRYQVNVLVNNKGLEAAPVVHESNPTYHNLIGRIEHHVQLGAFVTDFTLVKAGAFHRDAVARVVEQGLRAAEHQGRVSTHRQEIVDLVREAHHWARAQHAEQVRAEHVARAAAEKIYRDSYLEEIIGRMIDEGTIHIDADGTAVGQVNGLSVYDLGDYAFGKPSRVTAKVFLGKEGVVNIERESDLGGRIHNKGVLILQGYFGSRYARRFPIAFAATLCFEQSYGGVEGDSASSTELFALISALGELPLRQDLAVTGSVDQRGNIQAVGGINLKIEGFYKTCRAKGLTGKQGVVIPQANVRHLMLEDEVVEAVAAGRFHIHPVATVDEAMALLADLPAGEEDAYGAYPEGSVNGKVMRRLERLAELWRRLHAPEE